MRPVVRGRGTTLTLLQGGLAVVFACFPLGGVLVWDWSLREILFLYWLENVFLGIWTVVKLLTAAREEVGKRLFLSGFYTVHFGMFCLVHGQFLLVLTGTGEGPSSAVGALGEGFSRGAWMAAGVSFFMLGVGVVREYFATGRYRAARAKSLMKRPYADIIVLHVAIIAAGSLVNAVESAFPLLALVVVGKLVLDLRRLARPLDD